MTSVDRATTPTVAVIGAMGAGKTSIGRALARRLGLPFTDTDAAVVGDHGPIDALFRDRGEPAFRRLERVAVRQALRSGGVIALGGGAILDPGTRGDLASCTVVLLTVDEAAVAERLAGSGRPLLAGGLASWRRIAAERAPLYAALADVEIDTSHRPVDDVVAELADALRSAGSASPATPAPTATR